MKNKFSPITNLLEQIRQLDELLVLHRNDDDDFMTKQYRAKRDDFLKILVSELLKLNETSPKIFNVIKQIINGLEKTTPVIQDVELTKKNQFSIIDLESTVLEKLYV